MRGHRATRFLAPFKNLRFFRKVRFLYMKATGIVRRIDDLGRVVIPKEIRRTMRIREGDPLLTVLIQEPTPVYTQNGDPSLTVLGETEKYIIGMLDFARRIGLD